MSARYNFMGTDCPRCFRRASLGRPADRGELYECRPGCGALFNLIPGTETTPPTLEQVDSAWNAGARIADDHFCPSCGERGYVYQCMRCSQPERTYR